MLDDLEDLKKDLQTFINKRVIIREVDNAETDGTVVSVLNALVEMTDNTDNRVVRIRISRIASVDDVLDE